MLQLQELQRASSRVYWVELLQSFGAELWEVRAVIPGALSWEFGPALSLFSCRLVAVIPGAFLARFWCGVARGWLSLSALCGSGGSALV